MLRKHKREIIWISAILFILVAPLALISAPGMQTWKNFVTGHADKSWAPGQLETVGDVYMTTGRQLEAADCYAIWLKTWNKPDQIKYQDIYYKWALALDESGVKKEEAMEAYQNFMLWWPDHPKHPDADRSFTRLRTWH